jgi:PKHD-type hydroxylase
MTLILGDVLNADALAHVHESLASLDWLEGHKTAGTLAARVKHNQQADLSSRGGEALHAYLMTKIRSHPLFAYAAYPKVISRLMISKATSGQGYGNHIDNALMKSGQGLFRSDLSFTLFLSPPDTYQGGELVLETPLQSPALKLPAGDMILYATEAIHRVEPIKDGERIVCVGWIQSQIRDAGARQTLWDLETVRAQLPPETGLETRLSLDKAINSLLRRWADV